MPDLLIELFSEEIPARMQKRASEDLQRRVTDGLVEAGLTYAHAKAFATPRRLTLAVEGVLAASPATQEERKGPRTDAPEKALEGFLRSTGLSKDDLEARDDKKGQVWYATINKPGRPAGEIIAEVLSDTIRNFPWPKSMRWGTGSLKWVRPLHSILCVLSDNGEAETVAFDIDGIASGNTTFGHRFMAPDAITANSFEDYEAKLKRAHVVLSPEERAETIWHDATQAAFAQGLEVVEDKGLLAEVAGLVEWPITLMGEIGADFLELPAEVLQSSMKEHQKFFSVRNKTGKITHFVTVANVETADNGATILAGNQKVLSARLADAKFFWENDLRIASTDITQWSDALANVTFHNKLGTQQDRIRRIAALAREIAPIVGADADADADDAESAALIAKADLSSEMVYEFPELQGIMGEYYAAKAGHSAEIAAVAREHYQPLGPSDAVPSAPLSVAVALADKIDTLTGFWAIDEKPTGSKDPFALRRAALGVIRLVLENGVRVSLRAWLKESMISVMCTPHQFHYLGYLPTGKIAERKNWILSHTYDPDDTNATEDTPPREILRDREAYVEAIKDGRVAVSSYFVFPLLDESRNEVEADVPRDDRYNEVPDNLLSFLHDRLKTYLRDRDIPHDVIDASLAMPNADDLTLLVNRATALAAFLKTDDGENLLQGFKRAHNILKQAEAKDGVEYSYGPELKLAEAGAEQDLFAALDAAEAKIAPAMQAEDFATAMAAMASLRAPIDAFFEGVQVNAENDILRRNRLNLLHRISATCLSVADLTKIEG